jgi:hypothetical protein
MEQFCPKRTSPNIYTRPNQSFRSDTSASAQLRNDMVRETINVYKTSMNLGVEQRITLKQIFEKQGVNVETTQ